MLGTMSFQNFEKGQQQYRYHGDDSPHYKSSSLEEVPPAIRCTGATLAQANSEASPLTGTCPLTFNLKGILSTLKEIQHKPCHRKAQTKPTTRLNR